MQAPVMEIQFTSTIFKERRMFVAHTPELECFVLWPYQGKSPAKPPSAVRLFLEEAEKMGTLEQILEECGLQQDTSN